MQQLTHNAFEYESYLSKLPMRQLTNGKNG